MATAVTLFDLPTAHDRERSGRSEPKYERGHLPVLGESANAGCLLANLIQLLTLRQL